MLIVSLALLVFSVVAYFMPFVTYAPKHLSSQVSFSGYDFTRVIMGESMGLEYKPLLTLFEDERTMQYANIVAKFGPICVGASAILFIVTTLAIFFPKFNNVFVIGAYLAVVIVLCMAVLAVVGSMTVTQGDKSFNNYMLAWGFMAMVGSAIGASVVNVISNLMSK